MSALSSSTTIKKLRKTKNMVKNGKRKKTTRRKDEGFKKTEGGTGANFSSILESG